MLTSDQDGVAQLMSWISEDHYSAGWLSGLEYSLWDYVSGNCDPCLSFGFSAPNQGLIKLLKHGSEMIGGWIAYDFDSEDGRVFVPMAEWERLYSEHSQRRLQPINESERK